MQAPYFSQSFNRYSYVWNNPLKYTDSDGEIVQLIIGAIIGGYSGYKIGKAKGATGWGMFWHIAGGAAIGTVAGHVGASVFASGMAAGSAAGMGGISAGFNAGMLSGWASGAITGAGMAALGGGSFIDILSGATVGGWFGAVAGGVFGVLPGGIENLKDWKNFWGTKYTREFIASANPNEIYYAWGPQVTITARSLFLISRMHAATGLAAKYILTSASIATSVFGVASLTSAFYGGAKFTHSTAKLGWKMHNSYKSGLADKIIRFKEFRGIRGIRPDFVDFSTKTIYELKPFNPRAIKQGVQQLKKYKALFEKEYGGTWKTVLDLY